MRSFCLITTLDVRGRTNNREHHVIRYMARHFDEVIVVYRKRADPGTPLSAQLTCQISETREGRIRYVAVDPPLNPPEGTLRNATTQAPRASALRKAAGRALDAVAILRDRATIQALMRAARDSLAGIESAQVQAMGPWAAQAAETLRRGGVIGPYAYVYRDYEPGFVSSALRRHWVVRKEQRAAQQADLTIATSNRLARAAQPHVGGQMLFSPTGVDLDQLQGTPRDTALPELIYVGEVTGWACLEPALTAIAQLRRAGLEMRMTLLGPALPAYETHLRARITELDLQEVVTWPGAVPRAQVIEGLARAGIGYCVFDPTPLRTHAMPLKLAEYMAMGLPALATQGTEAGDVVVQSGAGLAIKAHPPEALAQDIAAALQQILSDPEAAARMSRAALTAARAFDWSANLELELHAMQALSRRPRGGRR
ncbi:MAG: glycosyltransferase [Pelagimonas sp.]|jgi:glycosyltransferase involved in cell wall biosynthesis|nr:glycosyltransferase [Pelagimonas sp.]